MSLRASDLWLEELADAAEVDGEIIHAALTVDLDIDSIVTIVRRQVSSTRPQGVAIDADHPMKVGDHTATRMVLWSDTAPDTVDIDVPAGRLTVWNVWRDDGAIQAWIGAAGMRRVELDGDEAGADFGVRLLATDGHDGSEIDLEFDVRISGARPTR